MKLHTKVLLIALALSAPAWAQTETPAPADEAARDSKVEVSGVKNPALRPYRIMSRGLDAFDKHHALAPGTTLRFELWNSDGTVPAGEGLALRLAGDTVNLPLAVDGDATFVLPRSQEAFDDNADLVLNRKKGAMRWRPRVRSPGVPDDARRLGDMRLECEVSWAVMKDEMSFAARIATTAAGGMCHAPLVNLIYRAPRKLAGVTIRSGQREAPLELTNGATGFIVPVRDRSWNDDSLVVYRYADAAPKEEGAAAP